MASECARETVYLCTRCTTHSASGQFVHRPFKSGGGCVRRPPHPSPSAAGQGALSPLHPSVPHIIPCILDTNAHVQDTIARVQTDLAVARTHCTLDAHLHSPLVRSAVRHPLRVRRAPMARSFRFGRYVTVGAGVRGLRRALPYRFSTFVRSCIALVVYVRETATL